jgi:hypothetical protein
MLAVRAETLLERVAGAAALSAQVRVALEVLVEISGWKAHLALLLAQVAAEAEPTGRAHAVAAVAAVANRSRRSST